MTIYDPTDVENWSGLDLHIWKAIQAHGVDVELIGNLKHGRSMLRRARKWWGVKVERKSYLPAWNAQSAKGYAADVSARLRDMAIDAVVSPSPIPLAFLRTSHRKILWTDANFGALSTQYDEFSSKRLCSASIEDGHKIERLGAKMCSRLVYASEWGAQLAVEAGAPREKVSCIPFGANFGVHDGISAEIEPCVEKSIETLRLLFVGVDWNRKGAAKAVAIATAIRERGVAVELTVVGCSPPNGEQVPEFVKIIGFISKRDSVGRERIQSYYRNSHLMLVPTLAEAYGLVFAEASAFGLPSVSHRVGGVPTIIKDEINGKLFGLDEPIESWVSWIVNKYRSPGELRRLAISSVKEYRNRLNWDSAGRSFTDLLRGELGAQR